MLVSRGTQIPHLTAEAPVGTTVELRLTLTPNWGAMSYAIGGGPALVTGGKAVFRTNEAFGDPILNTRGARSAVGQLPDGRILLVTVEGDSAAYSVGMTNYELAVAMQRLGAVNAMALGNGSAASMAFDGTLLSRPSTGGTRAAALGRAAALVRRRLRGAAGHGRALAERRRRRRRADVLVQARPPVAGDGDGDRSGRLDADARRRLRGARRAHAAVGRNDRRRDARARGQLDVPGDRHGRPGQDDHGDRARSRSTRPSARSRSRRSPRTSPPERPPRRPRSSSSTRRR